MTRDMTEGRIMRVLLLFSIPLILSGLLQQLYNIADAAIVGNFVGELELGAVGATSSISFFLINIIIGLTKGLTILVSQLFGAGERENINRAAGTFVIAITAFSILASTVGIAAAKPMLRLINTPDDIFLLSARYLIIIIAGVPFLTLYNIYGSMLRGLGDSRSPFVAIVVAAVVNVSLNLYFVLGLHMGIEGVAYATIIAQLFSALYLIWVVSKSQPLLRFTWSRDTFAPDLFKKGIAFGMPLAIQSSIMSCGSMMIQNVTNSFGTLAVTAITTAYRIDTLCMLPATNLSTALSTFTGQNIGAGKHDRVKQGFRQGVLIVVVVSLLTTSLVVFGSNMFLRFFGVSDEIAALGRQFLILCSVFYPVFGLQNAFAGFLQGAGDVLWTAGAHVAGLGVRVGLAYLLAGTVGFPIIAYSEIASWLFTAAACYLRYRQQLRRGAFDPPTAAAEVS